MASTSRAAALAPSGPLADYPMVLGDAFTVDGEEYVPADTASYDAVGFATLDTAGGQGVTLAHKTLPLPSYVEVTSLETGRTILVRVERRGPMTSARIVALSQAAQAQLGSSEGTPVRVRRVNPMEAERAELRAGRVVAERMDTPKSLLVVLARKLPAGAPPPVLAKEAAPILAASADTSSAKEPPVTMAFDQAFDDRATSAVTTQPAVIAAVSGQVGGFVIQAAAFSIEANAARAAREIGGVVTQSGKYFRVRTGPYATRGQAEAALAKVREAGYSDARVLTAG